jgi:hypothetical protein
MTIDVSVVPAKVTITNASTTDSAKVQMYGENLQVTLNAGDVLKLQVSRSPELLYYTLLNGNDGLTVTSAAVS